MTDKAKMNAMFGGSDLAGFFDLPSAKPDDDVDYDIGILGAPVATPYASVGSYCHDAPDTIRRAFGWPGLLDHHDFDLDGPLLLASTRAVDLGNLDCSMEDFAANREAIASAVGHVLAGGAVPIVFGGDDSVPIPVLSAYAEHGPIHILQLDAHIDWRDEVQGEKNGLSSNMRRASEMPWVEGIVQVGARGMGSARARDVADAREWGVRFFPMKSARQRRLDDIVEALPEGAPVYIALDIDALDPCVVPGVIGPAPGGFHYGEVL